MLMPAPDHAAPTQEPFQFTSQLLKASSASAEACS